MDGVGGDVSGVSFSAASFATPIAAVSRFASRSSKAIHLKEGSLPSKHSAAMVTPATAQSMQRARELLGVSEQVQPPPNYVLSSTQEILGGFRIPPLLLLQSVTPVLI